uniref:Uncharacterized protein n=1 Tax=uncultured marine virus TaxID=186617 RepID=A0A0F7L2D9_9VIRU|nr:hypothetical protein [uncultured marine virus]
MVYQNSFGMVQLYITSQATGKTRLVQTLAIVSLKTWKVIPWFGVQQQAIQ